MGLVVRRGFRPIASPPPSLDRSPAHVRIRSDALEIDGAPTFLFGGEVPYFRVRDPAFDGPKTHDLWARTLDRAREIGASLVSTYVPWDYHEVEPGRFDFSGARDLGRFLDMAAGRGLRLILKPGPFILAEWPHGFGSYGAVPLWWKRANRAELVRLRTGEVFCWHPVSPAFGRFSQSQPTFGSARFLESVERWFAAAAEVFRPFVGPGRPIVALQVDNETNLFWTDAYLIDFHPSSLAAYRALLRERYGTLGALSRAYGRRFRSFDDVLPPARAGRGPEAAHRDWFEHQQRSVERYQAAIRAIWERLGFREPDLLFLTNDTWQTLPRRDLVLPDGERKNRAGLHALDTYPRCVPRPGRHLFDRPYEPDLGAKLVDRYNDLYTAAGPSRFSFGIEVQGGHFGFQLGGRLLEPHEVRPEATLQTLLRLIAHGMKGISIYTLAGGLNLDGSSYDFQAAIPYGAEAETPRARAVAGVARLIRERGPDLLRSRAVESPLALLANVRALGPGHGRTGEQRIFGDVLRGLMGWLACSGFTPQVEDLALAGPDDLARFRALVFPCSGRLDEGDAAKLVSYVERGGTLVQLLAAGPLAASLFSHEEEAPPRGARADARFWAGGAMGRFEVALFGAPRLKPPKGAARVLAIDGERGVLGYERAFGRGRAIFLAVSPAGPFEGAAFYGANELDLDARVLFARRLIGLPPLFQTGGAHEEVHARLDPETGEVFLFVFSSREAGPVRVRPRALEPLGWEKGARYEIADALRGGPVREIAGAALREEGIEVELEEYGATVLVAGRKA
jgi:hypothetical protein